MTKDDLIRLAEAHYDARCNGNRYIDSPEFVKFPLPVRDPSISSVFVTINRGKVKEIELIYIDGEIQTIRAEAITTGKP